MRGCGPARCRRRAERKISKKTKTRAARTTRAARKENTMNTLRFDRSSRVSHVTHTRQGPVPAPFLTMRWARRVSAPSRGARPREPRLAPRASRTKPSPPPRPRRRRSWVPERAPRARARRASELPPQPPPREPGLDRRRGAGARPALASAGLGLGRLLRGGGGAARRPPPPPRRAHARAGVSRRRCSGSPAQRLANLPLGELQQRAVPVG